MTGLDLKRRRTNLKLTQKEFASLCNLSRDTIVNYEKMATIPHQKAEMLNIVLENEEEKSTKADVMIPYYDVDFVTVPEKNYDVAINAPQYHMDIPDFKGCVAFKAYTNSMDKKIKSGSILFAKKVDWDRHLEYGEIYGIVCTDDRKYLKYVRKHPADPDNYLLLKSDNDEFDDFELAKSEISSMWLIHGWLQKRV
jgi:transcriptional regulator with XRE-family HTH domain